MDSWGFVVAGYALTALALLAYRIGLLVRARRARRAIAALGGDGP